MPQKSWAVGEEVLAADLNSYLQSQTVPQFTNVAQRDSQWASPPVGAFCVTVDTGTVWQRTSGAWIRPFGVWGYAEVTAAQANIGATVVDLTGLSVAYTSPGLRRVRITVNTALLSTVAGDYARVDVTDGSGASTYITSQAQLSASAVSVTATAIEVAPAGAVTYKARCVRSAGSGLITSNASTVSPASIIVEDLGPQ